MAKKKKKKRLKKLRNWLAVIAHFRRSGPNKDKKKDRNKKACRGKKHEDT